MEMAPRGHASAQGISPHCVQSIGVKILATSGYAPCSFSSMRIQKVPGSVEFSDLHAITHAKQPVQRPISMAKP
ncbi:MAG: hypothetical protein A3G40_00535 [Deltaproteobacteria bacterium RIFCSPLOWO2_12_FULL_57_22]|nr:MAG: hypothetical protein A3G40_00535 [Deltaproteobacteria bacterium RIFCSPLOWO2_12_FULL_57_22]